MDEVIKMKGELVGTPRTILPQTKAILRTGDGLVQIRTCPQCFYMVTEADILWQRQPKDMRDEGEIKCCRFCASSLPGPVL